MCRSLKLGKHPNIPVVVHNRGIFINSTVLCALFAINVTKIMNLHKYNNYS